MSSDAPLLIFASVLLVLGSAFFVAAEYSLVSSRKSRLEAFAKQGNRRAGQMVEALDSLSRYVAASQVGITMLGIGVGAITEPFVTRVLTGWLGGSVDHRVAFLVSFLLVAFVLVVVGELVPKYATLRNPERAALLLFPSLKFISSVFAPLTWVAQITAAGILRIFGVKTLGDQHASMPKEELLLLVQTGGVEGVLEKKHADLVTRALRLDVLTARDIMVHRLDVKWIDEGTTRAEVLDRLRAIHYSRIPVCRGDIDDLVGVVYVHDIIRTLDDPKFNLPDIMCAPVAVPENLTMERIVDAMRESRSQILIVMDEYGGTSGIITIEDVVEEVFGELQDRVETQRPAIEVGAAGRVSCRADIRFDELVRMLDLPIEPGDNTDTLATLVVERLERMPKTGDQLETELGTLRVENMARNRITRVALQLKPELMLGLHDHTSVPEGKG